MWYHARISNSNILRNDEHEIIHIILFQFFAVVLKFKHSNKFAFQLFWFVCVCLRTDKCGKLSPHPFFVEINVSCYHDIIHLFLVWTTDQVICCVLGRQGINKVNYASLGWHHLAQYECGPRIPKLGYKAWGFVCWWGLSKSTSGLGHL